MNHERDLLFATLAWQIGFVSREDLVAALKATPTHREQGLGDRLIERGSLSVDRRELIDRLVQQHLQLPTEDASQSLAALPGAMALRAELEQILALAKGATLPRLDVTLPAVRQSTGEPQNQTGSLSPAAALRFTLLRPHAHGGLGEVFVAHDEELNREVALKRIRNARLDTPENRARFILEAEVTGGLEHPGIVPVYSLGTSDDGRPFYAMRFIKGESLKEAIRRFHSANAAGRDESERLLELRKLLSRFIDVCNAIEYAHSRGVLHRDLKPENIMLGAYGETLVVDWGLAKPIGEPDQAVALGESSDADSRGAEEGTGGESPLRTSWASGTAPTQMGSAVGTPAYMSPEQAAGQLDQVGIASDVYSLGATLYCLLAGQPPFDDESLKRLLDRVRKGGPTPPSAVRPGVPAALSAICLKAMSVDPSDRYSSPRALASEMERWLADEPVVAHRGEWHERLARWGRRHRRGVEAAAAALILVAAIAVVAALLVHSAKQQAEHERDATRLALEAETVAKHEAHAALAAEREARLEARRALDNYVGMVIEEDVVAGEQVQPLRKRLLTDALKYYEELVDNHDDGQARHDLANAILRVGRIHHATGSSDEAIAAFSQALTAFQELAAKHPDESQYQRDLALCYSSLAELKSHAGDIPAAVDYFRQSLEVWRQLVERRPQAGDRDDLAEASSELAQALASSAAALNKAGHLDESRAVYRQAIEHQDQARRLFPDNPRYREQLARLKQALSGLP
jgi:eukaryotic-like serine/threonine-protein kinase